MIRSHSPELASKVLEEIASPAPTGKCMVVTAIRDPRLAVPSKFFEGQKTFLCDGQQSKNQVIDLYRKYLQSAGSVKGVFGVTAKLLKDFGATSITTELRRLRDNGGFMLLKEPSLGGPWVGCELLVLDMEKGSEWEGILAANVPGAKHLAAKKPMDSGYTSREELCPNAAGNYHAIMDVKLPLEWWVRLAEKNPDAHEAMRFYENPLNAFRKRPPASVPAESVPKAPFEAAEEAATKDEQEQEQQQLQQQQQSSTSPSHTKRTFVTSLEAFSSDNRFATLPRAPDETN